MVMIANYYEWIKAFHIIFMTAWMAGMFYLPRLYVYHTEVKKGSAEDKRLQLMEKRLLRVIINPAMILTIAFGLMLMSIYGFYALGVWFHLKLLLVVVLTAIHGMLAMYRKSFALGKNKRSQRFFRVLNETITVIFVLIVILVVVKPFE